MRTIEEIRQILKEKFDIISKKYKVKMMGIFGSYVRREERKTSDVDILVEFEEPVSLLKLVNLENLLTDFIGVNVDLIPKEDIRPELKERILNEVIYI